MVVLNPCVTTPLEVACQVSCRSDTYITIHKLGGAQEYTKDIQDHGLRGGNAKEGGRQHGQVGITSSRMVAYCPPNNADT